jgi:hypothetical protein
VEILQGRYGGGMSKEIAKGFLEDLFAEHKNKKINVMWGGDGLFRCRVDVRDAEGRFITLSKFLVVKTTGENAPYLVDTELSDPVEGENDFSLKGGRML